MLYLAGGFLTNQWGCTSGPTIRLQCKEPEAIFLQKKKNNRPCQQVSPGSTLWVDRVGSLDIQTAAEKVFEPLKYA